MQEQFKNLNGADFQYDHRVLVPKKTYQATRKNLDSKYQRSVLGG